MSPVASTDDGQDILERAERRRRQALEVLDTLGLMERWAQSGLPRLVGAVRYGLAMAPDIDLAIYTEIPQVSQGFAVMSAVAEIPGVWKVRFSNELDRPDQGLYWQVRYIAGDGTIWKVDNWLLGVCHPQFVWDDRFSEALERALTPETRGAILRIKEEASGQEWAHGIDIYQAVIEGGIRSLEGFKAWQDARPPGKLNYWLPK